MLVDIAEHSICQPGRPSPQGDGHEGSPGFACFHRTKSSGSSFASSTLHARPGAQNHRCACPTVVHTPGICAPSTARRHRRRHRQTPLSIKVWVMAMISVRHIRWRAARRSGSCRPSVAQSSCMARVKRLARSFQFSPASAARAMILSSMSVTLRTKVTFRPKSCADSAAPGQHG